MARCLVFSILSVLVFISVISQIVHNFSHTKLSSKLRRARDWRMDREQNQSVIAARSNRLFWFVQVTDIHLSIFDDASRTTDFERFCTDSIPVIQPDLVIVSGDLTDGKTKNKFASRQYTEEWRIYNRILRDSNVLRNTQWLDLRGNHDAFNVPSTLHEENQFRVFGIQGPHHPQSYLFSVNKSFGHYSFIGLDACPSPGLKRPLNFFGSIDQDTEESIRRLIKNTDRSNHTFWFGHYPTSTIISPNFNLRETIGEHGFAYLCGHLHTFLNWVPRMYTMQPQGYLELELGDWRDNRYYRIVAVDHDLVSFVDVQMLEPNQEWPIVLITNPKNANFLLSHKEPVSRIAQSTHIRILSWSKWPIDLVSVYVDDTHLGNAVLAKSDDSSPGSSPIPLYVLSWNASQWSTGTAHTMTVFVRDAKGNERRVTQQFTVNGDPLWEYEFLPGFFLRTDHGWNLCLWFYLSWLSLFTVLLLPRYLPIAFSRPIRLRSCLIGGLFRLSQTDALLYPVLIYLVYQITCPIFMGFLLDAHFGAVFVFGIFVSNTFIRESLTYFQELTQTFLFTTLVLFPTTLYLGSFHSVRKSNLTSTPNPNTHSDRNQMSDISRTQTTPLLSLDSRLLSVPLILFLSSLLFSCLQLLITMQTIGMPYGWTAAVLSPGRWGPILVSWWITCRCPDAVLFHQANGAHK